MARPDKVAAVEEIAEKFRGASASVVTEYRGLTMSQLTTLRRSLGDGASYDFAKTNQGLVIKGGFMDGRALTVAEVNQLADLESREVMLSKLAGAMKGTMAKAAGLFAAPASQVARLAQALADKRAEEEGGGAAPTTEASADAES
jgi:large subunit ribosomal protein L10